MVHHRHITLVLLAWPLLPAASPQYRCWETPAVLVSSRQGFATHRSAQHIGVAGDQRVNGQLLPQLALELAKDRADAIA